MCKGGKQNEQKKNANNKSHIKPDIIQTILLLPSQKIEKPH